MYNLLKQTTLITFTIDKVVGSELLLVLTFSLTFVLVCQTFLLIPYCVYFCFSSSCMFILASGIEDAENTCIDSETGARRPLTEEEKLEQVRR